MILPAFAVVILSTTFTSCSHTCADLKSINGTADSILGKELYDQLIEKYEFIGNFEHGSIVVKSSKYGLLDYNGEELLPCKYDSISKSLLSRLEIIVVKKARILQIITIFFWDCFVKQFI